MDDRDFDLGLLIRAATKLAAGTGDTVDRMTYYSLLSAARVAKLGALLDKAEADRDEYFRLYMESATEGEQDGDGL